MLLVGTQVYTQLSLWSLGLSTQGIDRFHSGLGPHTSVNNQDSHPDMPTGQPDLGNCSSETTFPDDSTVCQVSVKANQGTQTSLGFQRQFLASAFQVLCLQGYIIIVQLSLELLISVSMKGSLEANYICFFPFVCRDEICSLNFRVYPDLSESEIGQ